ncbi:MAG: glycosyltransferase family protein [Synergistaceae bacterium]|jgi:spore coat polysaccharide biosynthesis protein SpsF|nr:glycosyltransferase family protein [Synergistaceae bacterium]
MELIEKNKKVVAVIQARMTSTRLPGKVMMPVLGKPLLGYELERAARAERISKIVVATTVNAADDVVARCAESLGFGVYRGSEDNVLERYHAAALAGSADVVVRLTADCPLIDPAVMDRVAAALLESDDLDYVSNTFGRRTYPRGLDTEVFTFAALDRAWREGRLPSEREHVTPYIYNHPEIFKLGGICNETDLSHHRWTVDTPEDFELIRAILEGIYPSNPKFSFKNVVDFMNGNPRLFEVNCFVKQKT